MVFRKLSKHMSQPKVFLIRHGHTALNKGGSNDVDRIRGWLDIPLNQEGIEDAEKAAKKLKGQLPKKIYSSDLIRAEQTADIINKNFHAPVILSETLRPWNVGIYTGKPTAEVLPKLNDLAKNGNDPIEDGESFNHFKTRFLSELEKIINEAKSDRCTIFVVTHFRNLKTCESWIAAGQPKDLSIDMKEFFKDSYQPGAIFEVPMAADKGDNLERR